LDFLKEDRLRECAALKALKSKANSVKETILNRVRRHIREFLRWPKFDAFIAVAVLCNSVTVGLEASYSVDHPHATASPLGWEIIGHAFNALFLAEVLMRLVAYGSLFFCGEAKAWNMFDFVVVLGSLVEVFFSLATGGSSNTNLDQLRIIRVFRILRILRILRITRIIRLLTSLRLLFIQIVGTLHSVFWAIVLLFIILYTFGMIFAQIVSEYLTFEDTSERKHTLTLKEYWGSVPRSMYTLYKVVTNGVDWEDVAYPLAAIHWGWVVLFNFFLTFTLFAVLNVVVGVFCQSAIQSANADYENSIRQKLTEKTKFLRQIRILFLDIDVSMEGTITYHEFQKHLDDERVGAYFEALGLDPTDAWDLFKLLDTDSDASNGAIDCEEFVEGCLRLRGPAKAIDIAKLSYENTVTRSQLQGALSLIEGSINEVADHILLRDLESD